MQVIANAAEAKEFAKDMHKSLADKSYWENWTALVITASPDLDWLKQGKTTALLRAHIQENKGSILWLEGCLIAVFPEKSGFNSAAFTKALTALPELSDAKIETISIDEEHEKVSALLAERINKPDAETSSRPPSFSFLKSMLPNIEDLFREWNRNKLSGEKRVTPHIMIVDDDLMTLRLVSQALEKSYTVHTAQSGAEAIAKHLQLKPDIIFLDIGLPDFDGLTVLNYIQQYDKECHIIMFSADDYLKTRLKARTGGAKGYLPKPFNLKNFQQQIAAWFSPPREKG